jgi:hypothetical protein
MIQYSFLVLKTNGPCTIILAYNTFFPSDAIQAITVLVDYLGFHYLMTVLPLIERVSLLLYVIGCYELVQ